MVIFESSYLPFSMKISSFMRHSHERNKSILFTGGFYESKITVLSIIFEKTDIFTIHRVKMAIFGLDWDKNDCYYNIQCYMYPRILTLKWRCTLRMATMANPMSEIVSVEYFFRWAFFSAWIWIFRFFFIKRFFPELPLRVPCNCKSSAAIFVSAADRRRMNSG